MIYVVIILTFLTLFFEELLRSEKADAVKSAILALTKFICLFCVISLLCFSIDQFKYITALLIELMVGVIYLIVVYAMHKKQLQIALCGSSLWIPLLIICIAFPFTCQKGEFFGMGQDEGVYQTEAIALAYGSTSLDNSFDEYDTLETESEKEQYLAFVDSFYGLYRVERNSNRQEYVNKASNIRYTNNTTGIYQGIHAFSALLGLWVKVLGYDKMLGILTVIYICSVFLLFFSVQHLSQKKYVQATVTALYAFSPINVWLSKTTYSESLVILCFLLFLYYLTKPDKTDLDKIGIGVATLYMCFAHIMFLVLYPAFWIVFILLSVFEKERLYFYDLVIVAAGVIVSALSFSSSAVFYYFDNLSRLYVEPIITIDNILYWIIAGAIISIAAGFIFIMLLSRIETNVICSTLAIGSKVLIIISIVYVVSKFYSIAVGNIEEDVYNGYEVYSAGSAAFFHTSLWALCCYCGTLVFPFLILKTLLSRYPLNNSVRISVFVLYIWFVFIYSALMKSEVWYYFYYSRYLGYVVPIVLIQYTMLLINNEDTLRRFYVVAIPAISLIAMIGLDLSIAKYKDDTYVEWRTIESISETINEDDAVVFADMEQLKYPLPIDSITDAGIYPMSTDLEQQALMLRKYYNNVYILADDNEAANIMNTLENDYQIVLKINNHSSNNRLHFIGGYSFENITDTMGINLILCKE